MQRVFWRGRFEGVAIPKAAIENGQDAAGLCVFGVRASTSTRRNAHCCVAADREIAALEAVESEVIDSRLGPWLIGSRPIGLVRDAMLSMCGAVRSDGDLCRPTEKRGSRSFKS